MPLHPEIAEILATLPAPPAGSARPGRDARRRGVARRARSRSGCRCTRVEDTTATTAAGDVPVRIYTPGRGRRLRRARLLPRRRVLPRQPRHARPRRAVRWRRRPGSRSSPSATAGHPRRRSRPASRTATAWSAGPPRTARPSSWDGTTLAVAGDSSGGNFVAAVAAMAHDDGFDRITHQVLLYPSLDLDFDVDRYASLRENAVGYGLETAGPEAVQLLLPRQRRRPGRPARLADQARRPHRPAPGADRHRPSTTRCATRASCTASGCGRPASTRRSAATPVPTTASCRTSPGSRSTTGSSRRPPTSSQRRGRRMTQRREDPPARLAVGPVRPLQLLHRRPRAGHRRHRDRLVAGRGHGSGARGARPPHRGRALDPADPRPHRPRRRRPRPVGAHRPARAGRHPRGRRAAAALAAGPRRRVPRRARALPRRPEGEAKQIAAATQAVDLRRDGADLLVRGGETLSLGGDVTVSVHAIPGHTPGSVAYVVDGQNDVFVGDAVQVHGAANGFPGYEDPDAYRASLRVPARRDPARSTCTSGIRTAAPTARRTASSSTREQAREALQESLDIEAGVARGRPPAAWRTDCARPTRRTRRSRPSPTSSATPATPRSSRRRSSPRCTATARSSPDVDRHRSRTHGRLRDHSTPADRRSPSARTCGSRCATASSSPPTPTRAPTTSRARRSSR